MDDELKIMLENVNRLNNLYQKSKSINGLTHEEMEEQGLLRERYMKFIKKNIKY